MMSTIMAARRNVGPVKKEERNMTVGESYKYSSAPERRERIVQFIVDHGYCTNADLSKAFGVSEMTIRRDVLRLVEEGKVRSFRGGVASMISRNDMLGSDYNDRDMSMAGAKRAVAHKATEIVEQGSAIAIDAGTTTNQLATVMPTDHNIKVVTHSFPVVSSLIGNNGVEVTCLGGTLHPESLSFDGPETLAAISNIQVDIFFLAASSIGDRGAFCGNGFDAITKRELIEVAEYVVLLVDSSKFSDSAIVKICDWGSIDLVIIDDGVTEQHERMLEHNNVAVMKVPTDQAEAQAAS